MDSTSSAWRCEASFIEAATRLPMRRCVISPTMTEIDKGKRRYDHQPAAYRIDDQQEDEDEGRVDEDADRVRGEELAHELILGHPICVFARRTGPRRQRRVQHFLEQQIGNPQIRLAPGIVDERRAGRLQEQVEQNDRADPDRQHPERRDRLVRQDPVIDVHGEDRRGDGEQVDEDRRQHDLRIGAPERRPWFRSASVAFRSSPPSRPSSPRWCWHR